MAKKDINLMDLNGPLDDVAALNTHKCAITRDYISQPRLSEYKSLLLFVVVEHLSKQLSNRPLTIKALG